MKTDLGIYLHIPFCLRKCNYCDFLSFPMDEDTIDRYVTCLCREIARYDFGEEGREGNGKTAGLADSIFIGGGTPSLLSENQVSRILQRIEEVFSIADHCEITIEANPKTLTEKKLRGYREIGVNRLSLGVQSMDDEILARLGRIHRRADFLQNYQMARKAGFENINTDLMFSLPGQDEKNWERTLSQVLDLQPEHISFYGLIIEEGTPFYEEWKRGGLEEVEDETDRRIYWYTVETLTKRGYLPYEISNAAKPGFYSRHNFKYWSMDPYVGFGLGAHSYLNQKRRENTSDFKAYLNCLEGGDDGSLEEPLLHNITAENGEKEEMEEFMFLGLRKTSGVSKEEFFRRFFRSVDSIYGAVLSKNKKEGLLEETEERIFLTRKGVDLSNYVMMQFLLEK